MFFCCIYVSGKLLNCFKKLDLKRLKVLTWWGLHAGVERWGPLSTVIIRESWNSWRHSTGFDPGDVNEIIYTCTSNTDSEMNSYRLQIGTNQPRVVKIKKMHPANLICWMIFAGLATSSRWRGFERFRFLTTRTEIGTNFQVSVGFTGYFSWKAYELSVSVELLYFRFSVKFPGGQKANGAQNSTQTLAT